ncbi:hypothetical protein ABT320_01435 [Streptomyces cellulosae]
MSAPVAVNTADGTCWTRRGETRGGEALYAPEGVCNCPPFVMATLAELAELGIVGSADALPMPVREEPQPRTMLDHARDALNARMSKDDLRLVLENTVTYAASLQARVAELEAAPVLVCRECAAPVRWVENTNGGWWNHTRPASDGHGVVPKPAEDPCHPCGCPTRFDRHADGCPTLTAAEGGDAR